MSQVLRNDYVHHFDQSPSPLQHHLFLHPLLSHHVDQLDVDTELVEAPIQVVHQRGSQLALDVTDLAHFDTFNVIPDGLLTLLSEKLLQLVGDYVG
jgi:hypothetical protein